MNDFFAWNLRRVQPLDERPALTEAQCDELFELFDTAGLPATAMNAEMADGYLTACQIGPSPVPIHEWMESIFGQGTLPICPDTAQQERLLELLVQRQWDIMVAMAVARKDTSVDNLFLPLQGDVAEQDRIQPCQLDAQGNRLGQWTLKDWAQGFRQAVAQDDEWSILFDDADAWPLLTPFVLFDKGHNPDRPEQQLDGNDEMVGLLVNCVYQIRDYWRTHHRVMAAARSAMQNPLVRALPKVGRNDPCACGSGKKYKKCCGAQ